MLECLNNKIVCCNIFCIETNLCYFNSLFSIKKYLFLFLLPCIVHNVKSLGRWHSILLYLLMVVFGKFLSLSNLISQYCIGGSPFSVHFSGFSLSTCSNYLLMRNYFWVPTTIYHDTMSCQQTSWFSSK